MSQATVGSVVRFAGLGLHSGKHSNLEIHPAAIDSGITFYRVDLHDQDNGIRAHLENVISTNLCTKIGNSSSVTVQTIEHLMAAFVACGISNANVCLDGSEVPAADGCAWLFAHEILKQGVVWQSKPQNVIRILRPVHVSLNNHQNSKASFVPSERFEMAFSIDYPSPVGIQSKDACLSNGAIADVLGNSRTFCSMAEVEHLHSMGYGLGGNIDIVVVIDFENDKYVSVPRHVDECVRHKMLDAVGDLALASMPIIGKFIGERSGHTTNYNLLQKLFSNPVNYEIITADDDIAAQLPGVNLRLNDL